MPRGTLQLMGSGDEAGTLMGSGDEPGRMTTYGVEHFVCTWMMIICYKLKVEV